MGETTDPILSTTHGSDPSSDSPVEIESVEAREARQEIIRARTQMGDALDHIGQRLSPERFKAEAVDAAHLLKEEAVEAVGKIKDDAIDTAAHLKDAAVEAARAATQEVIGGLKGATREAYDTARNRVVDTKNKIEGAGMTVIHTLKSNPIPAAMVGLGLYWLYQSNEESRYQVTVRRQRDADFQRARSGGVHYDYGVQSTPMPTGRRSTVAEAADDMRSGVADVVGSVQARAGEAIGSARDTVSGVAGSIASGAHDLADSVGEAASRLGQKTGERLEHYSDAVQATGSKAVHEFQDQLRSNPLAVAAVAAAVGLAFGMMLPDTAVENKAMGSTRDQFVFDAQESVQDTVQTIKEKATDLKEKAVSVVHDTAATAADAVKTMTDAADVTGKVADLKGKVTQVAQEAVDSITPSSDLPGKPAQA